MTITAAADGSALGNPGPSGWAWYVDDDTWAAGGWKHGTNNMGELKAVLELFRATAHTDEDLLILCDSQYVINTVTKWMPGWKRKGWRKGDGKPVMNLDLIQEIDEAIVGRRYRFEWVKGHAGHPLNEAADVRARGAAEAYQRGREVASGPGFPGAGSGGGADRAGTGSASERAGSGGGTGRTRIGGGSPQAPNSPPTSTPQTGPAAASATKAPAPTASHASSAASLFDFDDDLEPATTHDVTLSLTAEEYERLVQRARSRRQTPAEVLRSLI